MQIYGLLFGTVLSYLKQIFHIFGSKLQNSFTCVCSILNKIERLSFLSIFWVAEIAANVDKETLNILNHAATCMEIKLIDKLRLSFPSILKSILNPTIFAYKTRPMLVLVHCWMHQLCSVDIQPFTSGSSNQSDTSGRATAQRPLAARLSLNTVVCWFCGSLYFLLGPAPCCGSPWLLMLMA